MTGAIDSPAVYPSLKGRSTFITGGGSGIGASLVEQFCRQGAKVCFVDIAEAASRALLRRMKDTGLSEPHFINCDLRDIEALRRAVHEAAEHHGPIRVLVNNAG